METATKVGYTSSVIAVVCTCSFIVVQFLQILRLLPFPLDEILIYTTSLCISIPLLLAFLCFHYSSSERDKLWSHAALLSTVVYVVFVVANYVVQLATVIPAKLNGQIDAVKLLDQTPNSLFWDFDAIGYIFMGIATLFAFLSVREQAGRKWLKISFAANALATPFIAVVYFSQSFSESLLLLGSIWAVTAPFFMLRLALHFRLLHRGGPEANEGSA